MGVTYSLVRLFMNEAFFNKSSNSFGSCHLESRAAKHIFGRACGACLEKIADGILVAVFRCQMEGCGSYRAGIIHVTVIVNQHGDHSAVFILNGSVLQRRKLAPGRL